MLIYKNHQSYGSLIGIISSISTNNLGKFDTVLNIDEGLNPYTIKIRSLKHGFLVGKKENGKTFDGVLKCFNLENQIDYYFKFDSFFYHDMKCKLRLTETIPEHGY